MPRPPVKVPSLWLAGAEVQLSLTSNVAHRSATGNVDTIATGLAETKQDGTGGGGNSDQDSAKSEDSGGELHR